LVVLQLYQCTIQEPFYCKMALDLFPYSLREIKVDPLSG